MAPSETCSGRKMIAGKWTVSLRRSRIAALGRSRSNTVHANSFGSQISVKRRRDELYCNRYTIRIDDPVAHILVFCSVVRD